MRNAIFTGPALVDRLERLAAKQKRRKLMLKWFLQRQIAAFERTWNYDASYMHEMTAADPRAMLTFGKVQGLIAYRKDIPPAAYYAAGLVAAMTEDCGPCTQLGVDMAQKEGADPAMLRAIAAHDFAALPAEAALAARFTEAVLQRAPEADGLREEVERRFGKRGLISLAFAILAARMFPLLKYALGHGRSCTRLTIGGETRPVVHGVMQPAQEATAAFDSSGHSRVPKTTLLNPA
jgi:hypothetical protein